MKIAIVGQANTTLIEELIKAVEAKTGETVEIVNIHSKDADFLTQHVQNQKQETFILKPIPRLPEIIDYTPIKHTGHKRPYKYHP